MNGREFLVLQAALAGKNRELVTRTSGGTEAATLAAVAAAASEQQLVAAVVAAFHQKSSQQNFRSQKDQLALVTWVQKAAVAGAVEWVPASLLKT